MLLPLNQLHNTLTLSLLFLLALAGMAKAQAPGMVSLLPGKEQEVREQLQVYHDAAGNLSLQEVQQMAFAPLDTQATLQAGKTVHWVRVALQNNSHHEATRFLYSGEWSRVQLYALSADGSFEERQTGQLLPIPERDVPQSKPLVLVRVPPQSQTMLYLRLQGDIDLYKPQHLSLRLQTPEQVVQVNNRRLLVQGFFMGIILVMALYNLVLFFSVRDRSYLYFVLALLGTGLYFMFYHGFALELLWPNAPFWNAHSFAFLVTFNGLFRLLFTKSYLNTHATMPRWDKLLTLLSLLYALPVAMGLLSYLTPLDLLQACVDLIGIIGGAVLVAMLLVSVAALRQGYRPALYFLIANMFFVVGALLFILKEMHLLPNTPLTVYAAQVGMLAQVVLFSLGLAYRLNTVTSELAAEVLEKERLEREKETERKRLAEQQKRELEVMVANRTAALRHKTRELNETVHQLRESEHKLLRLNQLKDRFFSIISHDLRTPLATLDSFLNILLNFSGRMQPEQMQKLANHTQLSVHNLQSLLENLLQWASSQAGSDHSMRFEPEPLQVGEVVQRNLALLQDTAAAKQIKCQVQVPEELQVVADANMLDFLIRNLLHNAIKFSKAGGSVSIAARAQHDGFAEITVEDEGIGIEPSIKQSLFQREHPAQTTKGTANEKGVGLGLLLCRQFVDRCGGSIHVESEPNKGSRFWFRLPLHRQKAMADPERTLEGEIL
ncbi:sensor histidine kinase [Pontibacter flavimaris]|uniref:histidine kinase n=1 Tax=Pontibacter flavimaris TaxID=1797110 RepID=A0A1Q5PHM4_9BACT|nr:sensor histidine kinase [Pontibacter flavimaris]OKL41724.1 histidine kinase [Pontibacter flavimaris]